MVNRNRKHRKAETMRRRIAALLAALGLCAVVVTATAPNAFADRTVGWTTHNCRFGGGVTMRTSIYSIWFSSDGHRYINEYTSVWLGGQGWGNGGEQVQANDLQYWIYNNGAWHNYFTQRNPDPNTDYYIQSVTPATNPSSGHYWLARGRWGVTDGDQCDVEILN